MSAIMPAFLSAYIFWLQMTLGCLGILLINDVAGGRWGRLTQPFMLCSLPTLYVQACAFVPIALFARYLYPWAESPPKVVFFLIRGLLTYAIWIVIARGFVKRFRSGSPTRAWAGCSLLILLFSISFAAMDWLMTLSRDWKSTAFGVIFIAGCLCSGFSFLTVVTVIKARRIATADPKNPLLIDLGNLVLMSIMFWTYVDFMQYLIIWSGQLPNETRWYDVRASQGWSTVIVAIVGLNFVLPMLLLLFRSFKRRPKAMLCLAMFVLMARALESLIWVEPAFHSSSLVGIFAGAMAIMGLGVFWLAVFIREQIAQEVGP